MTEEVFITSWFDNPAAEKSFSIVSVVISVRNEAVHPRSSPENVDNSLITCGT